MRGPLTTTEWSERYQRSLRPSLLFLGMEKLAFEENRLIGSCMRERGWSEYPVPTEPVEWLWLNAAQTLAERRRLATNYGDRLLSQPSPEAGLEPYRRFADWLHQQSGELQSKYVRDFSGGQGEDDAPAAGSCKARAYEVMRSAIPGSVAAVETEAGKLYARYVVRTKGYRQAERAWRSCMRHRGYARVGDPLSVFRTGLPQLLHQAHSLPAHRGNELARSLSDQAMAEHACAAQHLDQVVQRGDRRVVRALIAKFPEYRRLVTQ
jgi:hypothetical protein